MTRNELETLITESVRKAVDEGVDYEQYYIEQIMEAVDDFNNGKRLYFKQDYDSEMER